MLTAMYPYFFPHKHNPINGGMGVPPLSSSPSFLSADYPTPKKLDLQNAGILKLS
jgi:hypothetical protein